MHPRLEYIDVVTDLRRRSASYRASFAIELSDDGPSIYVPPGVAHGFQALTDDVAVEYLMGERYNPEFADGFRYAYDGMHCRDLWRRISDDWRCPCCGRTKRHIRRRSVLSWPVSPVQLQPLRWRGIRLGLGWRCAIRLQLGDLGQVIKNMRGRSCVGGSARAPMP